MNNIYIKGTSKRVSTKCIKWGSKPTWPISNSENLLQFKWQHNRLRIKIRFSSVLPYFFSIKDTLINCFPNKCQQPSINIFDIIDSVFVEVINKLKEFCGPKY